MREFGPLPMTFLGADDETVIHAISLHDDWTREHGWWWNAQKLHVRLESREDAPSVIVDGKRCSVLWKSSIYEIRREGRRGIERSLLHYGDLPETTLTALVGRPLSLLIDAPGLESRRVTGYRAEGSLGVRMELS